MDGDDADSIFSAVFLRKSLSCNSIIEKAYFSAAYEPICFHYGADSDTYPICNRCLHDKKENVKRCGSKNKKNKKK